MMAHILLHRLQFMVLVFYFASKKYVSANTRTSKNNNNANENNEECSRISPENADARQQDGSTTCKSNIDIRINDQQFKWNLDSEHNCNVKRMSLDELLDMFKGGLPPLYHEPLLIYNKNADYSIPSPLTGCIHDAFTNKSSQSSITKILPDEFNVTLSSSNSFSAHRLTIPLTQYLDETISTETFPHQLSNETWYLFGETYSEEWKTFLHDFCLPPCQTCNQDLSALAFGIGGRGSGVQWHTHGPGFSQSIHGRKHWVLYPPKQKPVYDPDYTSRYWMEETYMKMEEKDRPYECTLFPGEMIYFPDKWHHATINLDPYTAFVSTFTTEHGF